MQLVVVESPKKAKTLGGFLGPGYRVAASFGHVRDLPPRDLGVDVQRSFRPQYVTLPRARQAIGSLKRAAADAQSVLLATDPDREGEAIAWHVATALGLKRGQYRRVAFHELSRHAVQAALAAPRDLDQRLVDSQQARRVLDRLVGYQLSPLLWRKVARGTSAGRVQSVAVRLIVDREREIRAFVPVEYWTIDVAFRPVGEQDDANSFVARLLEVDGKKAHIPDEQTALVLSAQLQAAGYHVRDTQRRQTQKPPAPPFTTSTLQQTAASRLRFPAKKTMACAQALFEDGLITYHRTDSVVVSGDAIAATRERIAADFGTDYLPRSPRRYVTRAKNAQEAHEAIRPVDIAQTPLVLRAQLPPDEWRIYDLVWKRMLASQMASARYQVDTLRVDGWSSRVSEVGGQGSETADQVRTGDSQFSRHSAPLTQHPSERTFALAAQATLLLFPGWLALDGRDAGETGAADGRAPAGAGSRRRRGASATDATAEKPTGDGVAEGEPADEVASAAPRENLRLPQLDDSTPVEALRVNPAQHFTQPPRRFTEAGLIKTLEEAGVGRPSTYAAIVSTIQDRSYVAREQGHFVPTELGSVANDFLVEHFPSIVDLPFTAQMEDELDEIASGQRPWVEMLSTFYAPFSQTLARAQSAEVTSLKATARAKAAEARGAAEAAAAAGGGPACPECGKPLIEKTGRFGSFFGCSGYPRCRYIHRQPKEPLPAVGTCPECGNALVERRARHTGKPFVGCSGYPACRYIQGTHERVSGGNGQAGDPAQPGDRSVPAYARGRRPAIRTPRRAAGARRWQPRRGTARAMEAPGQPRTRKSS